LIGPVTTGGTGVVVITGGLLPGRLPGLIGPVAGGVGVDVGVPVRIGGTLAPPGLLAIGPVVCGIGVGTPERIGGTPPGLLAELLDVVAGGVDVGSEVVGVAVMTGGTLPPPGLLLELLDAVADVLWVDVGSVVVDVVAVMTGGSLPPELLVEVATDPVACEAGVAVAAIGGCLPPGGGWNGTVALPPPPGLLPSDSVTCLPPCLTLPVTACACSLPWVAACVCLCGPPVLTARVWASAGALCSTVVSTAAPSAQAADVVKSLRSFIDVLLSVRVAAPFAATEP